ncbi:MAG TPA: hypothetical protein VK726_12690 [Acetobacteraceae bacterium]|jgi:hypothetical protein|nr:hypothetical protein [Acetobacteraceae bacterium]
MSSSPRKRIRPDTEVATLATQFAADWAAGDAVLTWLRRHVAALTRMIHDDGWSWPDLARALTRAGIGYRSGRPWTGDLLRKKAAEARTLRRSTSVPPELSGEALSEALRQTCSARGTAHHTLALSALPVVPAQCSLEPTARVTPATRDDDDVDLAPAFSFARLKGWSPSASQSEGAPGHRMHAATAARGDQRTKRPRGRP